MIRLGTWAAALALLALSIPRAHAAGISIVDVTSTGSSTTTLAVGDTLTVDLVVSNDTNLDIVGIGLIAYGYEGGLRMAGVESSASIFNTTVLTPELVIGGLPDYTHVQGVREYRIGSQSLQTQLTNAISLTPTNGDGSLDIGIGGQLIRHGDVHFRISFQATSLLDPTELTLRFGIGEHGRGQGLVGPTGALLPFNDAELTVAILEDPDALPDQGTGGGGSGTGTGSGSGTGTGSGDGSAGEGDEEDDEGDGSGAGEGSGGSGGSDTGSGSGSGDGSGTGGTGSGDGTWGGTGGGGGNGSTSTGGTPVPAVPEPGAALLFAAGLVTVGLVGRR